MAVDVEEATGILALHLVAAVHAGEADGHQVGQHSREGTLTNRPVHAAHTSTKHTPNVLLTLTF